MQQRRASAAYRQILSIPSSPILPLPPLFFSPLFSFPILSTPFLSYDQCPILSSLLSYPIPLPVLLPLHTANQPLHLHTVAEPTSSPPPSPPPRSSPPLSQPPSPPPPPPPPSPPPRAASPHHRRRHLRYLRRPRRPRRSSPPLSSRSRLLGSAVCRLPEYTPSAPSALCRIRLLSHRLATLCRDPTLSSSS